MKKVVVNCASEWGSKPATHGLKSASDINALALLLSMHSGPTALSC